MNCMLTQQCLKHHNCILVFSLFRWCYILTNFLLSSFNRKKRRKQKRDYSSEDSENEDQKKKKKKKTKKEDEEEDNLVKPTLLLKNGVGNGKSNEITLIDLVEEQNLEELMKQKVCLQYFDSY